MGTPIERLAVFSNLRPPFHVLLRRNITGLVTDEVILAPPGNPIPGQPDSLAFGIGFSAVTIPAGFGFLDGSPRRYFERLVQITLTHADRNNNLIVTETNDWHVEGMVNWWDENTPESVDVLVTPGVAVSLFWMGL